MPAPYGAFVMRNSVVTVNSVIYTNQITKARLVPDTPIQTMRTLVPDGAIQDVDSTTWTFEFSGVQTWAATGIAGALNTAAGTMVSISLQPRAGAGNDLATFTAIAVPVEFGGEQGSFRTFEAELPVIGTPTFSTSSS